jgi:predicted ATPase
VRELGTLELHPSITIVVGENGSGKSTLLEAVAVAFGLPIQKVERRTFDSSGP